MTEQDKRTALVVDDHKGFRDILPRLLGEDYDTSTASTAEEAVAAIQKQQPPYDVVVTDGLNGEYQGVVSAAREVGSRALLLTASPELVSEAAELRPPVSGLVKGVATAAEIREQVEALFDTGGQDSQAREV